MNIYKKLFSYVPRARFYGHLAVFLSTISVGLSVYGYYLLYRLLMSAVVEGQWDQAQALSIRVVAYLTLGALLYFVSGIFSHILGFRLETQLRKKGIQGLTQASFRFFDQNSSGEIRKTIDDNAALTHSAVAHMIPDNSQAFLLPLLALVLAFSISPWVGSVTFFLSLACVLILRKMMGGGDFMQVYQEALKNLSNETVEYVRGIQVVKIFGVRVESLKNLDQAIRAYSKYALDYSISCKRPYVFYQWMFFGLMALLIPPLAFFLPSFSEPRKLLVELLMILFLSGLLMVSFMKIMWAGRNIFNASYAIEALEALYGKMQEDVLTYGQAQDFKNYEIHFDRVGFAYHDTPVLEDLSLTLEEGKTYALVGPSGSGKTTLAKLLSGFYPVDSGSIKIGGRPLTAYRKEALIGAISFVFQDSRLFKKSIYDNVALGRQGASRAQVLEALSLAGCDEILDKFPAREKTLIGSQGVYLSGGEKQRIAIARAMLKDAKILIMDEASASIDPDNEYQLQKAFKNLMKGKTVLMIAHRLTSIRSVDEILVLEEGRIVERGSHEELMAQAGNYQALVQLYDQANEWRVKDEGIL